AHALGARYRGRPVGSVADMTVFSFHPVKHVTTGEGGVVLTSDPAIADRLRRFRHHGIQQPDRSRPWCYEVTEIGYNYRITDVQCALGVAQLGRLGPRLARRRALASRYRRALGEVSWLTLPAVASDVEHAWHIFVVLLEQDRLGFDRDDLIRA